MNNKTAQDFENEALMNWANQNQDRLNGRGFFSSLMNWPMDKFQDYKINRMMKMNPEGSQKRDRLIKEMESLYGDGTIDENEKKSNAYSSWQLLLKGQGLK